MTFDLMILGGYPAEAERRMYSGSADPGQQRERMLQRSMDEPETDAAYDIATALYRMDDADRRAALELLTDTECRAVSELMDNPLWLALTKMPDEDIVQLFDEMNK